MKSIFQYLFISIIAFSNISIQEIFANNSKNEIVLPEKLQSKINEKVTEKMTKDLNLSTKQSKKVFSIKLEEAISIEEERSDLTISEYNSKKNALILIVYEANKKILKVLKKDQDVIYEAKKSDYRYNPGLMENLKDLYNDTKESIKEKLGIK